MRLLAFDTTGDRLSLALADGERIRTRSARPARNQDDQLPGQAERLLRAAGLGLGALDAFAAASGPGRFTGIRVGLTFAGILARALDKPAVGVSWLEACAWGAAPGLALAVLPGWRGEWFFQLFRVRAGVPRPEGPPRWCEADGLGRSASEQLRGARARLVGPGAKAALRQLPRCLMGERTGPLDARDLLAPALARLRAGESGRLAPLYLKPAHYEPRA